MKCYGKQKRMEQRSCALLLVAVLLVSAYFEAAEAQFFTKSNSKSIPRMGRRSIQEQQGASAYRRALVDRLVDEYGPNLLEVLQARAVMDGSREFALRNEQPIDVADSFANYQDNSEADGSVVGVNVSRNERSSAPASQNYRDSSLAMRALNTKRLLQILSSGQPLMSADRMYLSGASGSDRGSKFSGDM